MSIKVVCSVVSGIGYEEEIMRSFILTVLITKMCYWYWDDVLGGI